jgi:hypothetical protein
MWRSIPSFYPVSITVLVENVDNDLLERRKTTMN